MAYSLHIPAILGLQIEIDEIPDLPGYVSTKEAAKMLGISKCRIRLYIELKWSSGTIWANYGPHSSFREE